MTRILILLAALVAAVAVVVATPVAAAPKAVQGTVGPGFTITLKMGGKKVTSLKAGTYRFDITDRSSSHDFHLIGAGVSKQITSVSFQGKKSFTVKLKRGTYRYICDPHASFMKGSFKVT
jgi:plastocyanin